MNNLLTNDVYYLDTSAFDHDDHGQGCNCRKCNANGRSYGVRLYKLDTMGIIACMHESEDVLSDWLYDADPDEVFYRSSEDLAVSTALQICSMRGYTIVGSDPFLLTREGPLWILTNGSCESTDHWTPSQFERLGIDYQKDSPYGPYPLTLQEQRFIGEDSLSLNDNDFDSLYLGYSAFWQGKKWLCPTLEYLKTEERDRGWIEEEKEKWRHIITPLDGSVVEEEALEDRYTLLLLIPFRSIGRLHIADFDGWKAFLEEGYHAQA